MVLDDQKRHRGFGGFLPVEISIACCMFVFSSLGFVGRSPVACSCSPLSASSAAVAHHVSLVLQCYELRQLEFCQRLHPVLHNLNLDEITTKMGNQIWTIPHKMSVNYPVFLEHVPLHAYNGYMSPEYVMHGQQFSAKSDVFSFGILVLEIISGKNNFYQSDGASDLVSHSWKLWKKGTPLDLMDPTLEGSQYSGCI